VASNYYLLNGVCYAYASIPDGYGIVTPGQQALGACTDTNCQKCVNNPALCTACLSGWYLKSSSNQCQHPTLTPQIADYFGANTTNITIADLQIWGPNKGIYSAQNNTETLQVGNCIISSTASHAVETTGGELYMSNVAMKNIGGDCFKIGNNGSHVYARGYAIAYTGMLVNAVTGGFPNFIDVQMGTNPFNTPDGTDLVGGVALAPYPVVSAATMALPANGSEFAVSGTATVNTINGKWGGREVTLTFTGTASLT
jgi:hypothetical protein